MSDHKLEKFSRDNLINSNLSCVCKICEGRLTKNNKGVPCSSCKSRIHVKCANTTVKDFHLFRGNWACQKCMNEDYPFTEIDARDLSELQFNSISTPDEKRFKPAVSVDEKLKLMLSYSKQSPWYAYTHPNESEHDFILEFKPPEPRNPRRNKNKRNILWYNPPFNQATKTNIGKKFLQLVSDHFPKNHPLHPICNRNTLKLSYSTTRNLKQIIQSHNQQLSCQ